MKFVTLGGQIIRCTKPKNRIYKKFKHIQMLSDNWPTQGIMAFDQRCVHVWPDSYWAYDSYSGKMERNNNRDKHSLELTDFVCFSIWYPVGLVLEICNHQPVTFFLTLLDFRFKLTFSRFPWYLRDKGPPIWPSFYKLAPNQDGYLLFILIRKVYQGFMSTYHSMRW